MSLLLREQARLNVGNVRAHDGFRMSDEITDLVKAAQFKELQALQRARERDEMERRRMMVARMRFIEANMTATEIQEALANLKDKPIKVTVKTIERDIRFIREESRRYLTADHFDARVDIGATLMRYDLLARRATTRALAENNKSGAAWARVAVLASEAKSNLLQDIGLVDRRLGTILVHPDATSDRIPSGEELQKRFDSINVVEGELVSSAEKAWLYGDQQQSDAAASEAESS
jgi:hypothetical protein